MNPHQQRLSPASAACRWVACAIASACSLAACGLDSVDGDNASIAVAQAAAPAEAPRTSGVEIPRDAAAAAAAAMPHCDVDGHIVCSMPRQRARAMRDHWVAQHHQWRSDGVDIAGADQPWYLLPRAASPGQAGTHYSVRITDGAGRSVVQPGVPAVIAAPAP